MVVSCFFCQNLLSDHIEGLLPTSRQEEIQRHLDECRECAQVHHDLNTTLRLLRSLGSRGLSHEMELKITGATHAGRRRFLTAASVSRALLPMAVLALAMATMIYWFPQLFPWVSRFRTSQDGSQFARYFPLLQGASEIVEEQANWLHIREPFMRSLWEEGGLSPEEFEKSFQGKAHSVDKETGDKKEEEQ